MKHLLKSVYIILFGSESTYVEKQEETDESVASRDETVGFVDRASNKRDQIEYAKRMAQ